MFSRWAFATLVLLIACGGGERHAVAPPPAQTTTTTTTTETTTVTTGAATAATPGAAPGSTPANAQQSAPVYSADDAVRDAMSGPLTLVGVGGWYGHYRKLACVYRNAQVIVTDVPCEESDASRLTVIIDSPSRGRVELTAASRSKGALASLKRSDYAQFEMDGAGPWAGPTRPTLTMGYDEIDAYQEERSTKGGACGLTAKSPQGICSVRAQYTAPAFAAANAHFLQAPPEAWYALVRQLFGARHASYAATDLSKASAKQLAAWGGWIGYQRSIDISDEVMPFVGQRDRFAAVVATSDGGMAIVGTRRGAQVVVARTDRRATVQWEAVIPTAGVGELGGTSLVAANDGFVVHSSGYPSPGVKARHQLAKTDGQGHVQWQWHPPDHGPIAVPQFFRAGMTPQGNVVIDGYVQTEKDGPVRGWTAEVSAAGKTVRDEVGSVELGGRNSRP